MTIKIDSLGNLQIGWKGTPIIGIYGRKGGGKTVFGEVCISTIFTKKDEEIINKEKIKVIDIWNPRSLGRSEGLYLSFPAKKGYAIQRAKYGLKSYGIPSRILIPNSKEVPKELPMNPQRFIEERPDLPESFKNIDLEFRVVTIPYKQLTGAELCLRYGRRETELAIGVVDRVIDHMKEEESTIHLANELRKFLSGQARTSISGLKSRALNTFLTKEIADRRSRRGVIGLLKPLIEEKMLASEDFEFNLNWEKEIEDVNRISVLYQGFLNYGTALMVTYWSMRKIIEVCIKKGIKVVFLVREIADIAPAEPNELFPQEKFGAMIMERIARQLRERVALIFDTQRPHLLINSLKTQADVNVYFNMQGQDLSEANTRLQRSTGINFHLGKGKYPALNKLEVGQCYIWDSTKMKLMFVRRVFMPPFRHWEGERNFLELWKQKGYPMKTWTLIEQAIEEELRKADEELYEAERKRRQAEDEEVAKMMEEARIEERATREKVLGLVEQGYSQRQVAERLDLTRHRVSKIVKKARKMTV